MLIKLCYIRPEIGAFLVVTILVIAGTYDFHITDSKLPLHYLNRTFRILIIGIIQENAHSAEMGIFLFPQS